jgi:cytidyltransferase-like protein
MSTVYTGGTFDLFHSGHIQFLQKCCKYGSVTVALNTDEFVEKFKGKRPVMSFAERYECLRGCKYVDYIVANLSGADSKPTIEMVRPDWIIIGDDWKDKDYGKQMGFTKEWLTERNIKLQYVSYTKNISTTILKARLEGII